MALFPRLSSAFPYHPGTSTSTRTTYRDDFTPFFSLLNDTFSELQRLSDAFPTENTTTGGTGTTGGSALVFAPKFDVEETDSTYELQGELPGVARDNLVIEFADEHTLTVKGRTEYSREQQQPSRNTGPAHQQQVTDGGESGGATTTTTAGTETAKHTADSSSSQEMVTTTQQQLQQQPQHHTYWVTERSVGGFSRTFSFPHRVDRDGATASLRNGVLSVVVPKLAPVNKRATRRTVTVEAE